MKRFLKNESGFNNVYIECLVLCAVVGIILIVVAPKVIRHYDLILSEQQGLGIILGIPLLIYFLFEIFHKIKNKE